MKEGIVVSSRYGVYQVNLNQIIYNVTGRGILKLKNKILVGDKVFLDDSCSVITAISPRQNELKRPLIANIDQIFIVSSIQEPDFSYLLVFKYLTYAKMNGVKAIVIISKCDLAQDEECIKKIDDVLNQLQVEHYFISSKSHQGIEKITPLFQNKISCLLGQTGVGKSSFMNEIDSNFEREIGEYSVFLNRGKHKTKEVILLPFCHGYIADTPGFSSLQLDINKKELAQYYPPFHDLPLTCFYSNCLHISEKNCKVKEALEQHKIPLIAYECYLKLLEELE